MEGKDDTPNTGLILAFASTEAFTICYLCEHCKLIFVCALYQGRPRQRDWAVFCSYQGEMIFLQQSATQHKIIIVNIAVKKKKKRTKNKMIWPETFSSRRTVLVLAYCLQRSKESLRGKNTNTMWSKSLTRALTNDNDALTNDGVYPHRQLCSQDYCTGPGKG